MSYPNIIYGDFGDEKVAQSTKIGSLPLGQMMVLPDGKKFRHARASTAAAMTAGMLYQTAGVSAGTGYEKALTCTAAVGDTSIVVTLPTGTAVVKDFFADGCLFVASSSGTGVGLQYKVRSNNSAAAGATCTVGLYPGDSIKVAIGGTTALVGLRKSEFDGLIQTTADTALTGKVAGIPQVATSAGFYHWIQRSGPSPAAVGGSVIVVGDPVWISTGEVGVVAQIAATTFTDAKARNVTVGFGLTESLTGGFSMIDLDLE